MTEYTDEKRKTLLTSYLENMAKKREIDYFVAHMPKAADDKDRTNFQRYFEMLETYYSIASWVAADGGEIHEDVADALREAEDTALDYGVSTHAIKEYLARIDSEE